MWGRGEAGSGWEGEGRDGWGWEGWEGKGRGWHGKGWAAESAGRMVGWGKRGMGWDEGLRGVRDGVGWGRVGKGGIGTAACASQQLGPRPGTRPSQQQCQDLLLCLRRLIVGSTHKVIAMESAGMPSNGIINPICSQRGNVGKLQESVP